MENPLRGKLIWVGSWEIDIDNADVCLRWTGKMLMWCQGSDPYTESFETERILQYLMHARPTCDHSSQ